MFRLAPFIQILLAFFLASGLKADELTPINSTNLTRLNLTEEAWLFDGSDLKLPHSLADLDRFINQQPRLDSVDSKGTRFWYVFKTQQRGRTDAWINISNRLVKSIRLYRVFQNGQEIISASGMLHKPQYPLTYGQNFTIPDGEATWIVEIEHPYIMGNPQIQLYSELEFKRFAQSNLLIVIGCIGTILLLVPYHILVGAWSKNTAYLWYAGYLAAVGLQWSTFFNIWEQFLGISSDFFNFTFFNLYVFFGTNFYLSFLRLSDSHRMLIRLSKIWRYTIVLAPLYFVWPTVVHYFMVNVVVGVWVCLALFSGIASYRDGYRPARFFVVGFSLIFTSAAITILSQAQLLPAAESSYRFSLIAQTLDVIFLSLALADQINILRDEKIQVFKEAAAKESHALELEKLANKTMAEANLKLDTALQVALKDKKQKQQYMMLIGHELKTPLHTIYTIIESATEQQQLDGEAISGIRSATNVLKRHIINLLTLAESSASVVKPLPIPTHIAALCDDVISEINDLFHQQMPINLEGIDQVPSHIKVDPILLQHLIFELLHNALRFSNGKAVTLRLDYQDTIFNVDIIDNGPGFPVELIEEFHQQQSGFNRDNNGLGIGLSIASNLLHVLGANLEIQAQASGGTIVSFHIFADAVAGPEPEQTISLNCLVVEDNPVNQMLLVKMLEKSGHKAATADNGQQALDAMQQQTFDIILMDLQMPVMDGFEATSRIRQQGDKTPIFAVTANTDFEARSRAFSAGVNSVIGKPIKQTQLEQMLSSRSHTRDRV